ncbi:glycosyl hydrolase family 43 [Neolewinella xylanilytica]|uniref:Glycosyl hydrolase family 43 n=1 Tax=Neolewinella xylanilytica TaxID=1514080 RepID=A0A2S6IB07_9BACT|nr:glycoside hydrolase family 43 protein [Neolewinella xylanilytica]PPK88639.1 glycosyl hydrolase family 43 [Neolewinella xylanilytica]
MQHISLLTFLAAVLLGAASCGRTTPPEDTSATALPEFQNPLDVEFGDPFILDDGDGTYYLYGTGGGAEDGFAVYSSTDLVDWKNEGQVYFGNTEDSWNESAFWAPECYKKDGKYYLFYSANWKHNPTNEAENFHIGVAVADAPTGPFTDLQNQPLFEPGYPIIDANVYQDDDGKFYLYYSRACYKHPVESEIADWAREQGMYEEIEESWVYGVELSPDFQSVIGEPVLLLRPPVSMDDENAEWESRSVTTGEINRRWTEGSFTFKHDGTYYIMYSANHYAGPNYAVGYATGDHPLGPFTKADNNPVLEKNVDEGGDVTGTGHNMVLFLEDANKMYAVYHGRTQPTGDERVVFMDELEILSNGQLTVKGPTTRVIAHPLSK